MKHVKTEVKSAAVIFSLLRSPKREVRMRAARAVGRTTINDDIANFIRDVVFNGGESKIKRELVSSVGRQKNRAYIKLLIDFLQVDDPDVVLQAVRGLLVFKDEERVCNELLDLSTHRNEVIREVVQKELLGGRSPSRDKASHVMFPSLLKNTVVHGNVLDVLESVPDNSFHLTFTSPPYYNARDYSIYSSYTEYLEFLEKTFSLLSAKTKEGRFFVLNTSPVITPRVSRQHASTRHPIPFDLHGIVTRLGWEFIDDIIWMKPETSVKNRIGGFMQHRKPLAYKPNSVTEYLFVYRKKSDNLIDWNIKQYANEATHDSLVKDGYETSNVWQIAPKHSKKHSAIFPESLCNKVIQYYSFVGDLVFDPFGGSGTLGRCAIKMGRNFFMTEKDSTYFKEMKNSLCSDMFCTSEYSFLSKRDFELRMGRSHED